MDVLSAEITRKYEVLEKLGEGGMGTVYKVRHRHTGHPLVIKVILASLLAKPDVRERFLREAKTAMDLRHPNIVTVTDYDVTSDGMAFLVMEFIRGVSLRELLARAHGPLDHRLVVNLGRQALAALAHMHRKKNVHRDISPDNFILTRDDDGNPLVKLIDLGITKSAEQRSLTRTNDFIGKASYAPPEQFRGEPDTRSDLYALGVMLYELLTSEKPIVAANALAIMAAQLNDPPRPFSITDPANNVPDALRTIVMRALEKRPELRWQTAQEFSTALAACDAPLLEKTLEVTIPTLLSEDDTWRAEEEKAWRLAAETDSIEAWHEFALDFSNSPREPRANERLAELIEERDWQEAAANDTDQSWLWFAHEHEESRRAEVARAKAREALERAEEAAWQAALEPGTLEAFENFVRRFPNASHISEARKRIETFEERRRAAETAQKNITSPSAARQFLSDFADSPLAADVKMWLEGAELRMWRNVLSTGTRAGITAFLRDFPQSPYRGEATRRLAEIESEERRQKEKKEDEQQWTSAREAGAFEKFAQMFPHSAHAAEARRLADEITSHKQPKSSLTDGADTQLEPLSGMEPAERAWLSALAIGTLALDVQEKHLAELQANQERRADAQRSRMDSQATPAVETKRWSPAAFILVALGTLMLLLGLSVVVSKGPQGWVEAVVGLMLMVPAILGRVRARTLLWLGAAVATAALIAYDMNQQVASPVALPIESNR